MRIQPGRRVCNTYDSPQQSRQYMDRTIADAGRDYVLVYNNNSFPRDNNHSAVTSPYFISRESVAGRVRAGLGFPFAERAHTKGKPDKQTG